MFLPTRVSKAEISHFDSSVTREKRQGEQRLLDRSRVAAYILSPSRERRVALRDGSSHKKAVRKGRPSLYSKSNSHPDDRTSTCHCEHIFHAALRRRQWSVSPA